MSYLVLARKYRPQTFDDVIGQDAIARTLCNAIAADRVGHAFLFAGPRGVGKTTMARLFAKALNCVEGPTPTPCGKCETCLKVPTGDDIDVIEIDGASTGGVDDARHLRETAGYAPAHSRFKIYIIDEVHMLSPAAFNALLKTLEEPPPHVKFIFATTEPHKVLDTIRSRCQEFTFRAIDRDDIVALLKIICEAEGVGHEEGALDMIARRARGGMRDSLSLLDRLIGFTGGTIGVDDTRSILGVLPGETLRDLALCFPKGASGEALTLLESILAQGVSPEELVEGLQEYLRDVLVARSCGLDSPVLFNSPVDVKPVAEANMFSEDTLIYMLQVLAAALREARQGTDGRIPVELALIKLCWVQRLAPIGELAERLLALEEKIRLGVPSAGYGVDESTASSKKKAADASLSGAAAPGSPLTLLDVQRHWALVVERLRHSKSMLANMLNEGRPSALDDAVLTVAFPESAQFACDTIGRESNQPPITDAISEVFDKSLRVKAVLGGWEEAAGETATESAEPSVDESPIVSNDADIVGDDADVDDTGDPSEQIPDDDAVEAIEAIDPVVRPLTRDERREVLSDAAVAKAVEAFQGHVVDVRRQ